MIYLRKIQDQVRFARMIFYHGRKNISCADVPEKRSEIFIKRVCRMEEARSRKSRSECKCKRRQ